MLKRYQFQRKLYYQLAQFILMGFILLFVTNLFAGTTDSLPWDTPGQKIEGWLTGSVAKIVENTVVLFGE
jgi:type IV secretory pathway VirB2 component (pilin)